jgi:ribosomal protein S18 acetylase RimI-like enzyme
MYSAATQYEVQPLNDCEAAEILQFLSERPIETVFMAGLIHDNGVMSELNRGTFHGYRNDEGEFEGVALIGHATLFEARTPRALKALARAAQHATSASLVRGNEIEMARFWDFGFFDKAPRLICNELLLEKSISRSPHSMMLNLRPATLDDLEHIVAINSQLFLSESGRNPLLTNPEGFRKRIALRISRDRVWVWTRNDEVIFKVEILADTPQAIYLESLYVAAKDRRKGYGLMGLTQLGSILADSTKHLCLTVNRTSASAIAFYRKAGYQVHSNYQTRYLQ